MDPAALDMLSVASNRTPLGSWRAGLLARLFGVDWLEPLLTLRLRGVAFARGGLKTLLLRTLAEDMSEESESSDMGSSRDMSKVGYTSWSSGLFLGFRVMVI
jgi:hypothetical protein